MSRRPIASPSRGSRLAGRPPKRRQRLRDLGDRRADVGVRLEDRREELRLDAPGSSLPSTPLRMRSTAATCSYVSASRIINSSSTPSENGGVPRRTAARSRRGADAVHGATSRNPRVVRGAGPELGAVTRDARVTSDVSRARGVPQQIGIVGRLPDQDEMRRGHEFRDEARSRTRGTERGRCERITTRRGRRSRRPPRARRRRIRPSTAARDTICPRSIAHKVAARADRKTGRGPGGQAGPRPVSAIGSVRRAGAGSPWRLPEGHGDGLLRPVAVDLELHLVAGFLLRDCVAQLLVGRDGLAVDADDDVAAEQVRSRPGRRPASGRDCRPGLRGAASLRDVCDAAVRCPSGG